MQLPQNQLDQLKPQRTFNYTPPPTLANFHRVCEDKSVRLVSMLGPVGPLSADTEFLTPNGWVRMDAYQHGMQICEWNHKTGEAAFADPVDYIVNDCDEFIHFHNTHSLSMVLSPTHRVPHYDWKGEFKVSSAAQLEKKPSCNTIPIHFTMPDEMDYQVCSWDLRLKVAIAADGHVQKRGAKDSSGHPRYVTVCVRKERKKERMRFLLTMCGIEWKERSYPQRPTEVSFDFYCPFKPKKEFSWDLLKLGSEKLEVFIDELQYWDGLFEGPECRYTTTNLKDAEIVQAAAHAIGRRATIKVDEYPQDNWADVYTVQLAHVGSVKNKVGLRKGHTVIERVPSEDGKMYCFVTNTSFFVARHNGRIFVTGNSAKSTTMVMQCLFFAEGQEQDSEGVRRTRIAIIRNSLVQLKSTCLVSIEQMLAGLYTHKVADNRLEFRYDMADGTKVHSDWLLLPLDTPSNINRLLSLELSHAWVSEFYSVPLDLVRSALSRVSRYPGKLSGVGCTNPKLIAETNAFTTENDYYEALYEKLPENWRHLVQPPAIIGPDDDWKVNPDAENLENLPDSYYQDLMKSNSKAWCDRFLRCKILPPLDQKAVFSDSYQPDIHEVDAITPIHHEPMCVGLDVGRNPAATFTQHDARGRILVLQSLHAENMGTGRFLRDVVMPVIASDRFGACPVFFCLDPASIAKSQFGEEALFTEVKQQTGLPCTIAHTNSIEPRLRAIEQPLIDRLEDGDGGEIPALIIDKRYNKDLCLAMSVGYRFKISKVTGELSEVPDKTHPESDICDSLGYSILGHTRRIKAQYYRQMHRNTYNRTAPPTGGWT